MLVHSAVVSSNFEAILRFNTCDEEAVTSPMWVIGPLTSGREGSQAWFPDMEGPERAFCWLNLRTDSIDGRVIIAAFVDICSV
eukprot:3504367-Rhodomonas_salina.2